MTRMLILCARNAHDQNVLARRPQWDQDGVPFQRRDVQASFGTLKTRARGNQSGHPTTEGTSNPTSEEPSMSGMLDAHSGDYAQLPH